MCVFRRLKWHSHDAWTGTSCESRDCLRRLANEKRQLVKYENRGWKEMKFDVDDELLEARSVSDKRCWNVLLDVNNIPDGKRNEKEEEEEKVRFALGQYCIVFLKTHDDGL